MHLRRWLLAPIYDRLHRLHLQFELVIQQGNAIMSALDDLKAADARIHDVVSAAKAAIANLGEQNAALKSEKATLEAQVADLTAKLSVPVDDGPVVAVTADLNAAADELSALFNPPAAALAEPAPAPEPAPAA